MSTSGARTAARVLDLDAAFAAAVRASAGPELSPTSRAGLEHVARDTFVAALQDYRRAVQATRERGTAHRHEEVQAAYGRLPQARERATRYLTRAQLRALEERSAVKNASAGA